MAYVLEIEAIGDDLHDRLRGLDNVMRSAGMGRRATNHDDWRDSRSWVRVVTGRAKDGGWGGYDLDCQRDYSRANSIGSRGIYLVYILEPGRIYEVNQRASWRRTLRYLCRVDGTELVEMTEAEVDEWLRCERETLLGSATRRGL